MARRSISEKKSIVRSFLQSGKSQKRYSSSLNMPSSTLSDWVKKYGDTVSKKSTTISNSHFIEVDLPEPAETVNPFCKGIEIKLPNGIIISGDFSTQAITTILSLYV